VSGLSSDQYSPWEKARELDTEEQLTATVKKEELGPVQCKDLANTGSAQTTQPPASGANINAKDAYGGPCLYW
jgi:hypothetical protein